MLNVPKALAATKKSDRQLGADVLATWRRLDKARRSFPKPEAIGVKLGLLRRGDTKWWTNQPRALEALAQILACRPNEIVAPDDSEAGAIPIAVFSELAPILPGQDACQLRDDGSWVGTLADSFLHQEVRAWIVAPSGSGKSLAVRVLRQRHGTRVRAVHCRRLIEIMPSSKLPLPLVAEVSEADPATDEAALKELSKTHANVCVLAPFSRNVIRDSERSRWRDVEWAPNADWRERLVKWANARAPKPADLDVEDVLLFLDGIDPHEQLFRTPGDVLAVVARAYRAGLPKGPSALRELACENLGRLFSSNESPWARAFGVATVAALVEGRLGSTDRPAEPLCLDQWAELLPGSLTPIESRNATAKPKGRHAAESVPAIQAVRTLVDAEVLRTTTEGRLDFAAWVRSAFEREKIGASLKGRELDWALWAVEPTRRAAVDDALDAASPVALLRLARLALAGDDSDLRTVAAIEAIFSAVARKLAREWKPPLEMVGDLQKLGARQLDLVRHLPQGRGFPSSAPLTRQPLPDDRGGVAAWIGEAWTFSFAVPSPKGATDSGWILPGWSRSLRIADAPETLPLAHMDKRILAASRAAVRACVDDALPAKVPYCVLPWAIIDGPGRGWTLTKSVQHDLFHTSGLAQLVGELLSSEATEVRTQGARSAWDAAMVESGGHPLQALHHIAHASLDLHRVVLDHLPAKAFESALRAKHPVTGDEGRLLRGLPARLVRPALVALVEQMEREQRPVQDVEHVLEALDEADVDLLLRFGAHGFSQGYAAARRVWSISPEKALEQVRSVTTAGSHTAQVWFDTAPAEHIPALLRALESLASPAPWCAVWLASIFPQAGTSAPAAFALLRSITT